MTGGIPLLRKALLLTAALLLALVSAGRPAAAQEYSGYLGTTHINLGRSGDEWGYKVNDFGQILLNGSVFAFLNADNALRPLNALVYSDNGTPTTLTDDYLYIIGEPLAGETAGSVAYKTPEERRFLRMQVRGGADEGKVLLTGNMWAEPNVTCPANSFCWPVTRTADWPEDGLETGQAWAVDYFEAENEAVNNSGGGAGVLVFLAETATAAGVTTLQCAGAGGASGQIEEEPPPGPSGQQGQPELQIRDPFNITSSSFSIPVDIPNLAGQPSQNVYARLVIRSTGVIVRAPYLLGTVTPGNQRINATFSGLQSGVEYRFSAAFDISIGPGRRNYFITLPAAAPPSCFLTGHYPREIIGGPLEYSGDRLAIADGPNRDSITLTSGSDSPFKARPAERYSVTLKNRAGENVGLTADLTGSGVTVAAETLTVNLQTDWIDAAALNALDGQVVALVFQNEGMSRLIERTPGPPGAQALVAQLILGLVGGIVAYTIAGVGRLLTPLRELAALSCIAGGMLILPALNWGGSFWFVGIIFFLGLLAIVGMMSLRRGAVQG